MELLIQQFLTALGIFVCLQFIVKCFGFSKYLFPRLWGVMPPSFFRRMGEWAVVTGAGDGIGKAYSVELANRGMNIVMISRTFEKMQKIAMEIEQTTRRKVLIIEADFTKTGIYKHIEENLKGLEIGILVNNVGMLSSPDPCRFLATPNNDEMTRLVLKQMEQRKKGLIVNVSSAFGIFPCPLYTIYSASKAFITTFSKALQAEYKTKGIIIQAVSPFGVSTPMTKNQNTNIITKSPRDFVRESLNHVTRGNETFGCLAHAVLGSIMKQIPLSVLHSNRVQETFLKVLEEKAKKK
ncbi:17-beta-hydroxysteroid dehydrogenase type 3 isoform X2 [Ranitomeya variabilis]|uniref:17-beta-hydroxysteroid dehydrogenase type 3 isoform X2 n=1 Tax=Ranitomeya variabilis TaxID=490064 RepID=UPI0040577386